MQLRLTMSKFRENGMFSREDAKKTSEGSAVFASLCAFARKLPIFLSLIVVVAATGCRRDMQDQPKMKPYRSTTFFGDGLSMRPPIEGTIPRGYLRDNVAYYTGKKQKPAGAGTTQAQQQPPATPGTQPSSFPDDVDTFPFAVTPDIVKRGRERYDIFCSACHGLTGNGDGMIVRRGFRRAASFNDDRLRQAPVGHFFDAMTNGWGAMPAYAPQIPVQDRWAIITYIRALQLSQQNLAAAAASPSPSASASATPAAGGQR
jgi:mono/diheme cytochrome c family protein